MKPLVLARIAILGAALMFGGCAAIQPAPPPVSSGSATLAVSDRLYCGRTMPKGGEVSDEAWARFLAEIVTPRFPEGFTVLRGEGQWRDASGVIWRERSFILDLNHADTAAAEQSVREIIAEYKRRFGQDAVFRSRSLVNASVL